MSSISRSCWEYQDLRAETIKVIQGTSRLNADPLLNSLVSETAEQIKQLAAQPPDHSRIEARNRTDGQPSVMWEYETS